MWSTVCPPYIYIYTHTHTSASQDPIPYPPPVPLAFSSSGSHSGTGADSQVKVRRQKQRKTERKNRFMGGTDPRSNPPPLSFYPSGVTASFLSFLKDFCRWLTTHVLLVYFYVYWFVGSNVYSATNSRYRMRYHGHQW